MRTLLRWAVRLLLRPIFSPRLSARTQRALLRPAGIAVLPPKDVTTQPRPVNGVPAFAIVPARAAPGRVLLYLHGGAFQVGGLASHGRLAGWIARATGSEVCFVDYRLAPEHPYPAALDDAIAAYRGLLERGFAAPQVTLAGDSAGGGLALATAIALRDRQLPLPGSLVLLSPMVDLSLGGESHRTHATRDPMLHAGWLAQGARAYAGDRALDDPAVSPLFASLGGLPRMLIQVGSEEILLSDAEALADRARAAGVPVELHCYDGMWHDFQLHAGLLPESDAALREIGAFVGTA